MPTTPDDLNRIIVVGNIMGQIGVVTWNGYEKHQENQNKEGKIIMQERIHNLMLDFFFFFVI